MKAKKHDDPVRVLERLHGLCIDGVEGYRRASEMVKEPAWLRRALASAAYDREAIAAALSSALAERGHVVEPHGSIGGVVHRALMESLDVYSPDGGSAIHEVLRECERGERRAIEAFSNALGRTLPDDLRSIVQLQFGRLLEASAALRREIATIEDTRNAALQAPSRP